VTTTALDGAEEISPKSMSKNPEAADFKYRPDMT